MFSVPEPQPGECHSCREKIGESPKCCDDCFDELDAIFQEAMNWRMSNETPPEGGDLRKLWWACETSWLRWEKRMSKESEQMSEYEGKVHRFECRLCGAPIQHGKRGRPRVYCEKCKPPRRLDKKPSET